VNAITAGCIGTRSHHTARLRAPSYGKGLADEGRIALLFDSAEKGVQVEVKDLAVQGSSMEIITG